MWAADTMKQMPASHTKTETKQVMGRARRQILALFLRINHVHAEHRGGVL